MLPEKGSKEYLEYLDEISRNQGAFRHKYYDESVKNMRAMGVHMTGDDPSHLLKIKRPNEDDEARQYRLDSYKAKTKSSAAKAAATINRIYNDRLFSITFPEDESNRITPEESLEKYLGKKMPSYVSLMNYIKSVFTRLHLKDANAVVGILPNNFNKESDMEFFTPLPILYMANEVVDFEDGEYYVILRGGLCDGDWKPQEVTIYDKMSVTKLYKEKQGEDFSLVLEYDHGFGIPPAFRVGGIVSKTQPPQLFESFISGVLPHWDDAVAMYSDLQLAIVNHLYPEKWEYTVDCDDRRCKGSGKIKEKSAQGEEIEVDCPTCKGSGKRTTKGPMDIYQVNKDALNPEAPLPMPPFGYAEKELGSTEFLEQLTEKEIKKGFSAINMDILNEVGENQSGVAKVIDRQDLDSFLSLYSDHVFNYVIPNTILFITLWRYWELFERNIDRIKEYLPKIKPPTTFDVFSITLLTDEFSKLSEAGVGGTFLVGLQKDIIDKRFSDEFTKLFYNTIIDVDPLSHLTSDEMMAQGRVIGQTEMYIHTYARDLVEEAQSNNPNFLTLPLQEKKVIIRGMAEAKEKEPESIEVQE